MKHAMSRAGLGLGWAGLGVLLSAPAWADNKAIAMEEMTGYLEFVDYGGVPIFPEQIPRAVYAQMMLIDARDDRAPFLRVDRVWSEIVAK